MNSLLKAVVQTWRSLVSFLLTFVIIGALIWFAPNWVTDVIDFSGQLKDVVMTVVSGATGDDRFSAAFGLIVGDSEIAVAIFMLLTRLVVVTAFVWIGSMLISAVRGR